MSKQELKDKKKHLNYEIKELVAFAFSEMGSEGVDRVINEVNKLANRIKSGKTNLSQIIAN